MIKEFTLFKTLSQVVELIDAIKLEDYFTLRELNQVKDKNKYKSIGARYLIKQKLLELIKIDNYKAVEIIAADSGKPYIKFNSELDNLLGKEKIKGVHISISHSRNYITSLLIIEYNV